MLLGFNINIVECKGKSDIRNPEKIDSFNINIVECKAPNSLIVQLNILPF